MKPTREEVLKLAEKAGFFFHVLPELAPTQHTEPHQYSEECFHRFAALLQAKTDSDHVAVNLDKPESSFTDEDLIAAVHKACGTGRVALTWINNDYVENPTDVARNFARALLAAQSGISSLVGRPNEKDVVGEGK